MFSTRFLLVLLLTIVTGAKLKGTSLCSTNVCGSCSKIVMMKAGTRRVQMTCYKLLSMKGYCNSRFARSAHHF